MKKTRNDSNRSQLREDAENGGHQPNPSVPEAQERKLVKGLRPPNTPPLKLMLHINKCALRYQEGD